MQTATLTREDRDILFAAHQELANVHGEVTKVTAAQHERDESAELVLDAQLAISDAMMAVAKALGIYAV
jgi:HEAT repeat protein